MAGLFSRIAALFQSSFNKKKREDEWAKNFSGQPTAKPKNLLPLDPGKSDMT